MNRCSICDYEIGGLSLSMIDNKKRAMYLVGDETICEVCLGEINGSQDYSEEEEILEGLGLLDDTDLGGYPEILKGASKPLPIED